jgi:ATP-dependent RNA helicase RhlE
MNSTVESISQSLYYVDKINKGKLLASLIKDPDVRSALVFTRTKHGADRVARELAKANIEVMAIHGNKSQKARQEALHRFMNGDINVLVATDIAARGIDIPELSDVFNYDIPEDRRHIYTGSDVRGAPGFPARPGASAATTSLNAFSRSRNLSAKASP